MIRIEETSDDLVDVGRAVNGSKGSPVAVGVVLKEKERIFIERLIETDARNGLTFETSKLQERKRRSARVDKRTRRWDSLVLVHLPLFSSEGITPGRLGESDVSKTVEPTEAHETGRRNSKEVSTVGRESR